MFPDIVVMCFPDIATALMGKYICLHVGSSFVEE